LPSAMKAGDFLVGSWFRHRKRGMKRQRWVQMGPGARGIHRKNFGSSKDRAALWISTSGEKETRNSHG
jgi:hypothetical protein